MVTISVCMIVKNEEKILGRCLDCLKDIADEIVIVDTGSSDGTKETAKAYTDRIYDFEWVDDFSKARNFAFEQCRMDYIYCADADEILDEANIEAFGKLKEVLLPEIDVVQMVYKNQLEYNTTYNFDSELRPKLYKRCRNFVWEGSVHETVRLTPLIYDSDIEIIHKPQGMHNKRDFGLFIKTLERDGNLDARLRRMYARELAVSGTDSDFEEAAPYFLKFVEEETDEDDLKEDLFVIMRAFRVSGDKEGFYKYALRAMAIGASSETAFELGEYYRGNGDTDEAKLWYYNAANETEPLLCSKYGSEYPLKYLK
ncbi:MAG: glycosyltransferase family 2 protein [Lachnospiraceae bacterium]|nr:glycosyltransferase family 2 protein [Lachnospiraceae bacterium]